MRFVRSRLFGEISLATAIVAALGFSATARATGPVFQSHASTHGASSANQQLYTLPTTTTSKPATTTNSAVVNFPTDAFWDYYPLDSTYHDAAVFIGDTTDKNKQFNFTVPSTAYKVTSVTLRLVAGGDVIGTASNDTTEGQGTMTTSSSSAFNVPMSLNIDTTQTPPVYLLSITDASVIVDSNFDGTPLYFEVAWTGPDGISGSSFSRDFTYIKQTDTIATFLPNFMNTSPVSAETSSRTAGLTQTPATATSNPSATNGDGSITGPTRSGGSSSSSSGLSKGAIAGIVVGAIAAIAIIATLAFFFLRRRRQRHNATNQAYNSALLSGSVEPYRGGGPVPDLGGPRPNLHDGTGSGTAVNLMEKDAVVAGVAGRFAGRDAGPDTPHSPHSPYTDEDGSTPQIIPARAVSTSSAGISAAASPTARTAQNVTPVMSPVAVPAQPVAPGSSAGASTGTAAAAQPAIRNEVAALIEDHMTPEDVARLEAEERELDADIENAIRNRAAAASR